MKILKSHFRHTKLVASLCIMAAALPSSSMSANNDASLFERAYAYAVAIDEYCFADRIYATAELLEAGQDYKVVYGDLSGAVVKAALHLKGDQSACANAQSFVDKIATAELRGRIKEAARAKLEDDYEARVRAAIAWCGPKIEMAKTFIAEGNSLRFTVLPDALQQCMSQLPVRPDTESLRSDAAQAIAAIPETERRAAEEKQKVDEANAIKAVAEAKAKREAEEKAFRPKRQALEKLVEVRNRRKGEALSVAQFCVYMVSPINGPVKFTPQLRADLDVCVDGLDSNAEADALSFVSKAAGRD